MFKWIFRSSTALISLGLFTSLFLGCASMNSKDDRQNDIRHTGPVSDGGVDGIYVPVRPEQMNGKKVLIIVGKDFNDMETFYPYYRLTESGYDVTVASMTGGHIQGYGGHILLDTVAVSELNYRDYDGLYLPGGKAPAKLRKNDDIISFVQDFASLGRPISAICHGPQILVTAGLAEGRTMTSFPDVGKEIRAAGGYHVDQPVAIDGNLVTSRLPSDLPLNLRAFLRKL